MFCKITTFVTATVIENSKYFKVFIRKTKRLKEKPVQSCSF